MIIRTFLLLSVFGFFLTHTAAAQTAGDPEKGKTLYTPCQACHGANGEGMEALNAPRLTGQYAWYLKRQLQHFKNGIRGAHPDDTYGQQMAPMAQVLPDEQAIDDVVAYIVSLKE